MQHITQLKKQLRFVIMTIFTLHYIKFLHSTVNDQHYYRKYLGLQK